jgi:hypothetical protein
VVVMMMKKMKKKCTSERGRKSISSRLFPEESEGQYTY